MRVNRNETGRVLKNYDKKKLLLMAHNGFILLVTDDTYNDFFHELLWKNLVKSRSHVIKHLQKDVLD